jgi:outer membrane protein OmpA-like peptidoglycan-associated protein
MRKFPLLLFCLALFVSRSQSQLLKKLGDKVKTKTEQRADQKVDQAIDKGLDKTEDASKNKNGTNPQQGDNNHPANTGKNNPTRDTADNPATAAAPPLKVYQNYDFVPGDKIVFEDNFQDDQDGEFPAHWELLAGQGILNKNDGTEAFYLTEGNYVRVSPRIKVDKYLQDPFTVEYDYYYVPGAYSSLILFKGVDKEGNERESGLNVGNHEASFSGTWGNVNLSKQYPDELREPFDNKWHHVSIAIKNHQLKVYVDQFRTLVVPDTKEDWTSLQFAGIGDEKEPIVFKNVRIALGGNMNLIGKKFTEAKIVTHGINFDVNKATIRPESMGTLNMIVKVMTDNPDIKFEVGGHTDSDGADDYNMKLSQQRAEAVRDQLIKLGIDASRLTAKGYGETKPISDNTTLEGKANNRRVEFVKL